MRLTRPVALALMMVALCAVAFAATATTKVSDVRRGDYVMLTGEVVRFTDEDEFVLRDASGSIRVYVGYRNRMPVRPGEKVTVEGFVDFALILEVYAWTITRENGEVINLQRGG